MSEDPQEAKDLAQEIDGENRLRQQMEADILQKAQQILDENPAFAYDRVLVLAGEEWHKGVIGIVASKMVERYAKPCILISIEGDRAKGSGRSIEGFSLYDAIAACSIHLTRFGGHKLAAGLELEAGNVDEFRPGRQCLCGGAFNANAPSQAYARLASCARPLFPWKRCGTCIFSSPSAARTRRPCSACLG